MSLPEIDVRPEDTLEEAAMRVGRAFHALGTKLSRLEPFAAGSEPAEQCRIYQGRWEDREHIVLVVTGPWSETVLIGVLNILLHIRTDPDPPGAPPRFRFFSAQPVPAVLLGLFGDSPVSELECRAALVAKFGHELGPGQAQQLGAVAIHLLRVCLGVSTSFFDPEGDLCIGATVVDLLQEGSFPQEAAPINTLIVLGFLYGELLRARATVPSRWALVKNFEPWPVLVFGPEPATAAGGQAVPQVVFKPIHTLLSLPGSGNRLLLRQSWQSLEAACREKLGLT